MGRKCLNENKVLDDSRTIVMILTEKKPIYEITQSPFSGGDVRIKLLSK